VPQQVDGAVDEACDGGSQSALREQRAAGTLRFSAKSLLHQRSHRLVVPVAELEGVAVMDVLAGQARGYGGGVGLAGGFPGSKSWGRTTGSVAWV
jgi:hypothetical protein